MSPETQEVMAAAPRQGAVCRIRIRAWGGRKNLKKDQLKTDVKDTKMVSGHKYLINPDALKGINSTASKARKHVIARSLPIGVDGFYYVPLGMVSKINDEILDFKNEFWVMVNDLCQRYESEIDEARETLGEKLFNAEDYPQSGEALRTHFGFDFWWQRFLLPGEQTQGLDEILDAEVLAESRRRAEAEMKSEVENWRLLLAQRFKDVVTHVLDRLRPNPDGTKKVFHSSIVDNVRDFLESMEHMNAFLEDQDLSSATKTMAAAMQGLDFETLKSSQETRAAVVSQISSLESVMTALIAKAPKTRSIKFLARTEDAA